MLQADFVPSEPPRDLHIFVMNYQNNYALLLITTPPKKNKAEFENGKMEKSIHITKEIPSDIFLNVTLLFLEISYP